ncbi:MAG: hypothetical protein FJ312_11300 [SAR202 cluster bacterium]|nr:hypothetical protein [SAR202 cluster bacterium]MBM3949798.1 hypothetical protein [SAR202 cluster bacterium]
MFDLLTKGGMLVDGTGSAGYYAAVAVEGDTVGILRGDVSKVAAKRVLDATGRVVTPGFISTRMARRSSRMRLPGALAAENTRIGRTIRATLHKAFLARPADCNMTRVGVLGRFTSHPPKANEGIRPAAGS